MKKANLKKKIKRLEEDNASLKGDLYHLCEDYYSSTSLAIRLSHDIVKAIDVQLFLGNAT